MHLVNEVPSQWGRENHTRSSSLRSNLADLRLMQRVVPVKGLPSRPKVQYSMGHPRNGSAGSVVRQPTTQPPHVSESFLDQHLTTTHI